MNIMQQNLLDYHILPHSKPSIIIDMTRWRCNVYFSIIFVFHKNTWYAMKNQDYDEKHNNVLRHKLLTLLTVSFA